MDKKKLDELKDKWDKVEAKTVFEKLPWWQEKEIKEIAGKVLSKEFVTPLSKNVYVVETVDGKINVGGSAVLDRRFEKVNVGDYVKIVFLGKEKTQDGTRSFKNYDFYVVPGDGAPRQEPAEPAEPAEDDIPF